MTKRHWVVAGLIVTAPCLLCTALLFVIVFVASIVIMFSSEWAVDNRTSEPLWVTPLASGSHRPVPLPNYSSRFPINTLGEVSIQPGECTRFFIDAYVESDCPALGLVVRTSNEEYFFRASSRDNQYVLDDLTKLPRANAEMISAWERARTRVDFGIPFLIITTLGLVAPVVFLRLRRSYRSLKKPQ